MRNKIFIFVWKLITFLSVKDIYGFIIIILIFTIILQYIYYLYVIFEDKTRAEYLYCNKKVYHRASFGKSVSRNLII